MKRTTSILLLTFYVCAQCFLPGGNFAYIEQIPDLYADFCKTNDTDDVFEFLEEQFFELGFPESDEDIRNKEPRPVPFQTPSAQTFVAFIENENTEFIPFEETKSYHFIYIIKEHQVVTPSVYHPPKNNQA
jgi:hypothetical protein